MSDYVIERSCIALYKSPPMSLTKFVRNLEKQLKSTESFARRYDAQALEIRTKLTSIAQALGHELGSALKKTRKDGMSPAGRARIAAAQKTRWAKVHARRAKSSKEPAKAKRTISKAHRAAIVAAQKKRWAAHNAKKMSG